MFDVNSVLDLNAFERQNKAEGLGMVSEEGTSEYYITGSGYTVTQTFTYTHTSHTSHTPYLFLHWFVM